MKAKVKGLNHIRTEKKWIVFHNIEDEHLDSFEESFHSSVIIDEAMNIVIEQTKKEEFENTNEIIDNLIKNYRKIPDNESAEYITALNKLKSLLNNKRGN